MTDEKMRSTSHTEKSVVRRKRRIVQYGGKSPGWYVWNHIEEPPFLAFVGRYRTRAGAREERESDRVKP